MKPQHRIERSDTFGANTQADLELIRRINERATNRDEEVFALLVVAAAIACVCGIAGVIAYAIWS